MKSKAESEGGVRVEELEESKRKLQSKITELEQELEQSKAKASQLEKLKIRLQV